MNSLCVCLLVCVWDRACARLSVVSQCPVNGRKRGVLSSRAPLFTPQLLQRSREDKLCSFCMLNEVEIVLHFLISRAKTDLYRDFFSSENYPNLECYQKNCLSLPNEMPNLNTASGFIPMITLFIVCAEWFCNNISLCIVLLGQYVYIIDKSNSFWVWLKLNVCKPLATYKNSPRLLLWIGNFIYVMFLSTCLVKWR